MRLAVWYRLRTAMAVSALNAWSDHAGFAESNVVLDLSLLSA